MILFQDTFIYIHCVYDKPLTRYVQLILYSLDRIPSNFETNSRTDKLISIKTHVVWPFIPHSTKPNHQLKVARHKPTNINVRGSCTVVMTTLNPTIFDVQSQNV